VISIIRNMEIYSIIFDIVQRVYSLKIFIPLYYLVLKIIYTSE
jgi:hypothetical protein